jgi:hypothetical protein
MNLLLYSVVLRVSEKPLVAAIELPRNYLLGIWVNRHSTAAPAFVGWHHARPKALPLRRINARAPHAMILE